MHSVGRFLFHVLLWTALCCFSPPLHADASLAEISPDSIGLPIDQIRISGNEKTQEKYILKWIGIRRGQLINISELNTAYQELLDTGLFKHINFQTERLENGELSLHIRLEEKNYWLLLPRINRNTEGDVKAGFRLRMYNLQGADQTLELLAQQEEESNGDEAEQFRFRYLLPLFAKPYELSWRLDREIENTEVDDFANVEITEQISMQVSRDWHLDSIKVPLTVETAITLEQRQLDEPYPEDLEAREAGNFNRLSLGLVFDDVHYERYRRFGSFYSAAIEHGFDWLGSDYESSIFKFEAIGLKPLNRYDNFNYRLVFEVSNDSPFGYLNYDIGGGSSIRGLENVDERGDARIFANLEYIFAYQKHPGLRHSLFLDIGNVYPALDEIDLSDQLYTIGTGFRWKIESFVKTDLFLDYGYDVEEQSGKFYGGTSLTF